MGYHLTITQELPEHRKLLHLYRILATDEKSLLFGCMIRLYLWGIKEAPDGDIGDIHPIAIAEAAGYPGDAEQYVDALIHAKIIDIEDGLYSFNPIPRDELTSKLDEFMRAAAARQAKHQAKKKADREAREAEEARKQGQPPPAPPKPEANGIPPELVNLRLYETDKKLCERWPELYPAWKASYPKLDIMQEIKNAHAWELSNEKNRKKNRPRFLNSWLNRASTGGHDGKHRKDSAANYAAAKERGGDKFAGR